MRPDRPHLPGPRRGGFTLVEVLVVVAILTLLVAILVPSLAGARAQARRVSCQSNLHNIGLAWHEYLDANQGRFLRGHLRHLTWGGKQGTREGFWGVERPLNKYLHVPALTSDSQRARIFACPGDERSFVQLEAEAPVYAKHYDLFGTSYRTNRFLIGPQPPPIAYYDPCKEQRREAQRRLGYQPGVGTSQDSSTAGTITRGMLSNESRLILLGDYGWEDWWYTASLMPPVEFHARSYRQPTLGFNDLSGSRHNIGFMDGHAEFVEVRKGLHVTSRYTVIPFRDMQEEFERHQKPGSFF